VPARHEQTILAGRRIRNPSFTLKIAEESRDGGITKPAALTRKALQGAYTAIERRPLRIDLTHSTGRCRMAGVCAFRPAGVDVRRSFRIAARTLPWREERAPRLAKRPATLSEWRCLNRAVRPGNGRTIVKLVDFSAHQHGRSAQRFMPKVRNLARARPWSSSAFVASPWQP
jgi:hypothetical protein